MYADFCVQGFSNLLPHRFMLLDGSFNYFEQVFAHSWGRAGLPNPIAVTFWSLLIWKLKLGQSSPDLIWGCCKNRQGHLKRLRNRWLGRVLWGVFWFSSPIGTLAGVLSIAFNGTAAYKGSGLFFVSSFSCNTKCNIVQYKLQYSVVYLLFDSLMKSVNVFLSFLISSSYISSTGTSGTSYAGSSPRVSS